jgi:hypothetical protein
MAKTKANDKPAPEELDDKDAAKAFITMIEGATGGFSCEIAITAIRITIRTFGSDDEDK